MFGLKNERGRAVFFLEADRGGESLERGNKNQTSILEKMQAYAASIEAESLSETWNLRSFRVLFVTTSEGRAANMQAVLAEKIDSKYHRFFFFAGREELRAQGVENYSFLTGKGERKQLFAY